MSVFFSPTEITARFVIFECIARGSCCSSAFGAKSDVEGSADRPGAKARHNRKMVRLQGKVRAKCNMRREYTKCDSDGSPFIQVKRRGGNAYCMRSLICAESLIVSSTNDLVISSHRTVFLTLSVSTTKHSPVET